MWEDRARHRHMQKLSAQVKFDLGVETLKLMRHRAISLNTYTHYMHALTETYIQGGWKDKANICVGG